MIAIASKPKLIISKPNVIYKPKPKRVYKSEKNLSFLNTLNNSHRILANKKKQKKFDLNLTKKIKSEKFNEKLSLEEIEKDFNRLKVKREITLVERELKQIMEDSTKFNERKNNKTKEIQRPKNVKYILYNNFDFDFDYFE